MGSRAEGLQGLLAATGRGFLAQPPHLLPGPSEEAAVTALGVYIDFYPKLWNCTFIF